LRQATDLAELLRVYAQPQRLQILFRLLKGECAVSAIDAATGIGQPALSQQLAVLRNRSLVASRRDGTQVLYRLGGEHVASSLLAIGALVGMDVGAGSSAGATAGGVPARPLDAGGAHLARMIVRGPI